MAALVIDLPRPPSVNAIWRSRTGANGKPQYYLDKRYATWKRAADNLCMAKGWRKQALKGPFKAIITIDSTRRNLNSDIDNRAKAVLDFLERAGIIENDKLCEKVAVQWGRAPEGCRVVLTGEIPSAARPRVRHGEDSA